MKIGVWYNIPFCTVASIKGKKVNGRINRGKNGKTDEKKKMRYNLSSEVLTRSCYQVVCFKKV